MQHGGRAHEEFHLTLDAITKVKGRDWHRLGIPVTLSGHPENHRNRTLPPSRIKLSPWYRTSVPERSPTAICVSTRSASRRQVVQFRAGVGALRASVSTPNAGVSVPVSASTAQSLTANCGALGSLRRRRQARGAAVGTVSDDETSRQRRRMLACQNR